MAKITDFAVPGSYRKGGVAPALKKAAPPKKKRAKYVMTRPMKGAVQKLINANLETNQKTNAAFGGSGSAYLTHQFSYNPRYQTVGTQRDLMKLIGPIEQGVEMDQREGREIKLMSLRSRFHFYVPSDEAQRAEYQHFQCRLLVLSTKKINKYSELVGQWEGGTVFRDKLLKPDSEEVMFQNDPYSINWRVNRELFTVHKDKRFNLSRGQVFTSGSGSGGHVPTPFKTINVSLKVKSKKLLYSDPTEEGATNFAPFAILLIAPSSVSGGSIPAQNDLSVVYGNCHTVMTYKDA